MISVKRDTLKEAIRVFGCEAQLDIVVEELAELTCAIQRRKRGRPDANVEEEMGDVFVILEQLKMIYGISESEIQGWIDSKIERLQDRIEKVKRNAGE